MARTPELQILKNIVRAHLGMESQTQSRKAQTLNPYNPQMHMYRSQDLFHREEIHGPLAIEDAEPQDEDPIEVRDEGGRDPDAEATKS